MTTFLPTAVPPVADPWRDPKAAMERQCRHVTGASLTLRRGTLLEAAINLGGNPGVMLEAALPALLAAAQAGGYTEEIEGEAIADFIRRWLWARRKQLPGCNNSAYEDWARPQPKPPQAAPALERAAPDASAAQNSAMEEPTMGEAAMDEPPPAPAPAIVPKPLPVIAAEVVPLAPEVDAVPENAPPQPGWDPILQSADAVAPEPVEWLWKHRIARGRLTLIGGAPGSGKSTMALGLIAAVTTGGQCPGRDGGWAPLGAAAILVCEEAAIRDSIKPGLAAAGADCTRVGLLSGVPDGQGGKRPFDLANDLALLERAIESCPDVRLVVIDPVNAFVSAADAREDKLGALLHPLAALAAKHRVAVVVIAHPPKGNYLKPNVQALGSAALTAAARTAFLVQRDPFDPSRAFLAQIKNTLAPDRGTYAFAIERRELAPGIAGAVAVWDKRRHWVAAADLIGPAAKTNSAKAEAHGFLQKLFTNAPAGLPVTAIEAEARAAGLLGARQPLSQCRALRDARLMLKLNVVREGFGAEGRWVWTRTLPKQPAPPTAPAQPKKPKKTNKQKKKEFRAKKVERRRLKAVERRAKREAARALTSMAETSSMAETACPGLDPGSSMAGTSSVTGTSSMEETTSMASADTPAPALAPGQGDTGGSE